MMMMDADGQQHHQLGDPGHNDPGYTPATPKCNPGYTKSHPGNTRATHRLHLVAAEGYAHVARGLRPVVPWSQQHYTHLHPGYTRPRLGYMNVSPRLHPRHARVTPES